MFYFFIVQVVKLIIPRCSIRQALLLCRGFHGVGIHMIIVSFFKFLNYVFSFQDTT